MHLFAKKTFICYINRRFDFTLHVPLFQLSFIYQWSLVYNIVRFYSDKKSNAVEGNISINSPDIEEPHVLSDSTEEDGKVGTYFVFTITSCI